MQANRISPCSCSYVPAGHSGSACSAGFSGRSLPVQTPKRCRRARPLATAALHAPEHLQDLLPPLMDHLFMAYERVTLPCHTMGCGDYVHRRCAGAYLQACFKQWTPLDITVLAKNNTWPGKVPACSNLITGVVHALAARWTRYCDWSARGSRHREWRCSALSWHTFLPDQVCLRGTAPDVILYFIWLKIYGELFSLCAWS